MSVSGASPPYPGAIRSRADWIERLKPVVVEATIGWLRMKGRPAEYSAAKLAYSSNRPTPKPKSTPGSAVWSVLMIVGKAALTSGLLPAKLPVSSNSRKTSTIVVTPPPPGIVMLTDWLNTSPLASDAVITPGVTTPTEGLLVPAGQRIPPELSGKVSEPVKAESSRTTYAPGVSPTK